MTPELAAQVAESRRRQGLPPCITSELFLSQLAAALLKVEEVADASAA